MTQPLRILAVCAHNRTRSVLMAGLLHAELSNRGIAADISTAGFARAGLPADPSAVQALVTRGIDTGLHSTQVFSIEMAENSDLILTAERIHVVRATEGDIDRFARTFTLPELVERAEALGPRGDADLAPWLAELSVGRTPAGYLTEFVPELEDPTGFPPEVFRGVVESIELWCRRLAALL